MNKIARVLIVATAALSGILHAQELPTLAGSKVHFATAEEAGKFLAEEDDYLRAVTPFQREIFLRSTEPVALDAVKAHVAKCGRDWADEEKKAFTAAFTKFAPNADRLKLRLPAEILLIKTNGDEDFGAPYTRRNAIIFPERAAKQMRGVQLPFVCAHELFHVFSRHNPALHDAMYGVFGFEPVVNPPEPEGWRERGIINPDALTTRHALVAKLADGSEVRAAPYLISRHAKFDPKIGKKLTAYLEVVWLEVPKDAAAKPRKFTLEDFTDFAKRTGNNTGYTIHPEEISADNFAHILTGLRDVETPEKLNQLEAALTAPAK